MNTSALKARAKEFGSDIGKHEVFLVAGSIAYTTALALAPFIIIMLSVAALLGPDLQQRFFDQMTSSLGAKAGATIEMIVENADNKPSISGLSGLIGFLVLAFSASAIFSQLRVALDKINEHKADDNESGVMVFLKDKLFSVGLVFGFIFLSVVSMLVTTAIGIILPNGEGLAWQAVSFAITFLMFTALFTVMFRFIPTDHKPWRSCWISGMVGAIFYLIGKVMIEIYLSNAGIESAYGAAGSLVIFLVWVYYAALTLLISFEFTKNVVLDEPNSESQTARSTP